MDITKIKLNGYNYNPNIIDRVSGAYFDKDGSGDDCLHIVPTENFYVVTVIENCEEIKVLVYEDETGFEEDFEKFLKTKISFE